MAAGARAAAWRHALQLLQASAPLRGKRAKAMKVFYLGIRSLTFTFGHIETFAEKSPSECGFLNLAFGKITQNL